MKYFNVKALSTALALAGLMTASAYVNADNSASAYTGDGNAVIGEAAARASMIDEEGYTQVLSSVLKNSGTPKDLVIGLSFETSLFTMTMVQSKKGKESRSTADAEIIMKVLVDGQEALPGPVVFDRRHQELWAKLGGVLDCIDGGYDGTGTIDGIISFDECDLTDEEIGLILDTTAAHSFNFLAHNIGSGSHTIEAYAKLTENDAVVLGSGDSGASASLGKGTLSVWEVQNSVTH